MTTSHSSDRDEGTESSRTHLGLIDWAARRLTEADREVPRRTAEWMLAEVLGGDRAQLYSRPEHEVSKKAAHQYQEMVERRVQGEPLQHILGHTSFRGLRLQVSPAVMIPRPETEVVVDRALTCIEETERPRVLDVGTGSGCIALALKHARPDAVVYACDVSPKALAVARTNAANLGLDVQFFEADVLVKDAPHAKTGNVTLLVSNPPYIPNDEANTLPSVVREYDPDVSLFAGDDPFRFYRGLCSWIDALCAPGSAVVFEVHAEYAEGVEGVLRQEGLVDICLDEDLNGRPRVVWGRVPKEV